MLATDIGIDLGTDSVLVYIKGTEKRNVKNAKKMKKGVDIWQNIWYSNTRPKRPGQTSERNPRVSERNQKEIKKVLDKQNTA